MKPGFAIVKPDEDIGDAYDISAVPLNIVIGPDGRILDRFEGFSSPTEFTRRVTPFLTGR